MATESENMKHGKNRKRNVTKIVLRYARGDSHVFYAIKALQGMKKKRTAAANKNQTSFLFFLDCPAGISSFIFYFFIHKILKYFRFLTWQLHTINRALVLHAMRIAMWRWSVKIIAVAVGDGRCSREKQALVLHAVLMISLWRWSVKIGITAVGDGSVVAERRNDCVRLEEIEEER